MANYIQTMCPNQSALLLQGSFSCEKHHISVLIAITFILCAVSREMLSHRTRSLTTSLECDYRGHFPHMVNKRKLSAEQGS